MVVRASGRRFIIPTVAMVRAIRPLSNQLSTSPNGDQFLTSRKRLIPLVRLEATLGIESVGRDLHQSIAIVVEDDGKEIGLLVDELLGQQQVVIKSLGRSLSLVRGVSGGAIMPDGKVELILALRP